MPAAGAALGAGATASPSVSASANDVPPVSRARSPRRVAAGLNGRFDSTLIARAPLCSVARQIVKSLVNNDLNQRVHAAVVAGARQDVPREKTLPGRACPALRPGTG